MGDSTTMHFSMVSPDFEARPLFCQLSVVKMGYPGAQVGRLLGVSTSAVVRAAHSVELPEVRNYL